MRASCHTTDCSQASPDCDRWTNRHEDHKVTIEPAGRAARAQLVKSRYTDQKVVPTFCTNTKLNILSVWTEL